MDDPLGKVAEPKELVPTELLREKIRNYSRSQRERLRANTSDALRFGLGEIQAKIRELDNLTEKDVSGLAARIKRRKHATPEDMYRLSHAFLQGLGNISAFAKIPGAIQVLVKEFTGNDTQRQLSAAECLCNFSLGESAVCEKMATIVGSYLVTYLHSTEPQIVRLCLWTVANILATGGKGALILLQMQLVSQLWRLYTEDGSDDDIIDCREDAAICLQLISTQAEHLLSDGDRSFIMAHLSEKDPTSSASEYHLQIVFHCIFSLPSAYCLSILPEDSLLYLMNYSLNNLCNADDFDSTSQRLRVLYAVRVLSNLLASVPVLYEHLLQQLSSEWHLSLVNIINKLFGFRVDSLTREVLWFVKNILELNDSASATNLLNELCIYRTVHTIQ